MSETLTNPSQGITITQEEILHQVKISCQIPAIIEQIITRKIVASAAKEAGIEITTAELQQAADQMRVISELKDAKLTWQWLEKNSLSLDDFEEIVYSKVISGKLAAHFFKDKVEPYFYENQLNYAGAVIYEIILDDEDEAIKLFHKIQEGEITFFEATQKYIEDLELRRKGGYRGKVAGTELPPEVSAAVFAVDSPQFLEPIISSKGVHLIKVEEIITSELDSKLRNRIMLDMFSQWLKQQTDKEQFTFD